MLALIVVWVIGWARLTVRPTDRLGSPQARREMAVGAVVGVAVDTRAVPVSVWVCAFRSVRDHSVKLSQRLLATHLSGHRRA